MPPPARPLVLPMHLTGELRREMPAGGFERNSAIVQQRFELIEPPVDPLVRRLHTFGNAPKVLFESLDTNAKLTEILTVRLELLALGAEEKAMLLEVRAHRVEPPVDGVEPAAVPFEVVAHFVELPAMGVDLSFDPFKPLFGHRYHHRATSRPQRSWGDDDTIVARGVNRARRVPHGNSTEQARFRRSVAETAIFPGC